MANCRKHLLVLLWVVICALTLPGQTTLLAKNNPIDFKELLPFVDIQIPGWQKDGNPTGFTKVGTDAMTKVETNFNSGNKRIKVYITDSGGYPQAFAGLEKLMEMKGIPAIVTQHQIQGFKAIENSLPEEKVGGLAINVANRFFVAIEGNGLENTEILHSVANQLDLKKLATLAK